MQYVTKYDPQVSPITEYACDTEADIQTLPTKASKGIEPGSTCLVIATSSVYMLNSNDEQKEI